MFNYIIYHRGCVDGFAGFLLFKNTKYYSDDSIIYPDVPHTNKIPPNIKDKVIIIIDVAYKAEIFKQIISQAKSVLIIDHHVSTHENYDVFSDASKSKLIYDVNESGTSLVWKTFYPDQQMPIFIKYVRNNDIGNWDDPNTMYFITMLGVNFRIDHNESVLNKWYKLLDDKYAAKLLKVGKIYYKYREHLTKELYKSIFISRFPNQFLYEKYVDKFNQIEINKYDGYKVAVFNLSDRGMSDLSQFVFKHRKVDFCIFWYFNMEHRYYKFFLRSNVVAINRIAEVFGGGGHKLAASFSISADDINIADVF